MAACRYHPDRSGVGVCMRCRSVICSACCTRVDGVNHCHACLNALAVRDEPTRSSGIPMILAGLMVAGCGCLLLFALAWLVEGRLAP